MRILCLLLTLSILVEPAHAQQDNDDLQTWLRPVVDAAFNQHLPAPPQSIGLPQKGKRSCETLLGERFTLGAEVVEAQSIREPDGLTWCRVTAELTSTPGVKNTIWLGLPEATWNGRFLGMGGAGFMSGNPVYLPAPVRAGFVAASSNAGRPIDIGEALSANFVRTADGEINWPAVRSFASLGLHEMTLVGKAVSSSFYGASPRYAYFSGCSAGGRQGLAEIQQYPDDYDGVLAGAPVINLPKSILSPLWPLAVMHDRGEVASCKLTLARNAMRAACSDNRQQGCDFDLATLVGRQTECGAFSKSDADIIHTIWDGPRASDGSRLWYGTPEDLSAAGLAIDWTRYFLGKGESWEPDTLGRSDFEALFLQSANQFGPPLDTADPNIEPFQQADGKLILWHGLLDSWPAQASVNYTDAVVRKTGVASTSHSLRLFLMPDVGHCGGGPGAQPRGMLEALVAWVETGKPPDAITTQFADGTAGTPIPSVGLHAKR